MYKCIKKLDEYGSHFVVFIITHHSKVDPAQEPDNKPVAKVDTAREPNTKSVTKIDPVREPDTKSVAEVDPVREPDTKPVAKEDSVAEQIVYENVPAQKTNQVERDAVSTNNATSVTADHSSVFDAIANDQQELDWQNSRELVSLSYFVLGICLNCDL